MEAPRCTMAESPTYISHRHSSPIHVHIILVWHHSLSFVKAVQTLLVTSYLNSACGKTILAVKSCNYVPLIQSRWYSALTICPQRLSIYAHYKTRHLLRSTMVSYTINQSIRHVIHTKYSFTSRDRPAHTCSIMRYTYLSSQLSLTLMVVHSNHICLGI